MSGRIPVFKPLLPTADKLLPYLSMVDQTRIYSNRGPLLALLEQRLTTLLAGHGVYLLATASGTASIEAAIIAAAGQAHDERPLALMPSYTFAATAFAAITAGYKVACIDLEPGAWAMCPRDVLDYGDLNRVGLVLPVAPYGMAPAQREWSWFQKETGIPVVIDAAASFEAIRNDPSTTVGEVPVALSFHATKPFSTAEGGAVIWSNVDGMFRVARTLNFGRLYSRSSTAFGFNGKLSEYHAALGLAALDVLPEKTSTRARVLDLYRSIADDANILDRITLHPTIASTYALFEAASDVESSHIVTALDKAGVESRFWYGEGVHAEPHFRTQSNAAFPVTEQLAKRLIGIPIADDLNEGDMTRIVTALQQGADCA